MRLNVTAFALSCGVLGGIGLFLLTWWRMAAEGPTGDPTFASQMFRGCILSPMGSVVGLVWGGLSGMLGGSLLAWLYNTFVSGVVNVLKADRKSCGPRF
jgi:hypothetical protein